MKIYSKSRFFCGLAWMSVGAGHLIRGISDRDGFDSTMGVLFGILAIVSICLSMDEDQAARDRELDQKTRRAAEKRFGKWAWPARLLGVGLAVLGVVLLFAWRSMLGGFLLILAGLIYTLAVETALKGWTKKDGF